MGGSREQQPQRAAIPTRPRPPPDLPARPRPPQPAAQPNATPLRGAAGKIAQNMEASLAVPTATSIRNIPVKALEENRRVVNHHLSLIGQSKASYTHVVAWAIVNAIRNFPRMNAAFVSNDGQPARLDHEDATRNRHRRRSGKPALDRSAFEHKRRNDGFRQF